MITFTLSPQFRCPKCGAEYAIDAEALQIESPEPGVTGTYCSQCWARFVSTNTPRLIRIVGKSSLPEKNGGQ